MAAKEHICSLFESICTFAFLTRLILNLNLMPLIDQFLLPLNVFEHVFGLGDRYIVGEDLRVVLVELVNARQAILRLIKCVESLEVLGEVVKD